MTPQQRAAKTRAQNKSHRELYELTTKPAHAKVEKLLNSHLAESPARVRFVGPMRLKGGATHGALQKITFGGLGFTVLVDGYTRARDYSSSFWELDASGAVREE